jgi:hypothetical protein
MSMGGFYHRRFLCVFLADRVHMMGSGSPNIWYDCAMALFGKGKSRTREILGRIALAVTIVFGFISVLFSRDFPAAGGVFHDQPKDGGVAHADVGGSGAGDSGGSTGDSGGSGSSSDSGDSGGDSGGCGDSGGSGGSGG